MQLNNVMCINPSGFHKLAYTEWGQKDAAHTIVCVHGLTRNGRDFDFLAEQLSGQYRVICPDLAGRGSSDKLANSHLYNQFQYAADLTTLIARLNVKSIIWIGSSLGGALGMYLAAQPNTPIQALVLNDIGPLISKIGIRRIIKYTEFKNSFKNLSEVTDFLRSLYKTSETLTDEQWHKLAKTSVWQIDDDSYVLAYDPNITGTIRKWWIPDINLWNYWNDIKCPALTIRGADSDILLSETATQMQQTGPRSKVIEIPNCGHAPMLMTIDQTQIITNWLAQTLK